MIAISPHVGKWLHPKHLAALLERRSSGSYRWIGSAFGYSVVLLRDKPPTAGDS